MTLSQRRLAGLWPWLLMAALQVVFGQTGLELAAAVESERSAPKAVIKVTPLKPEQAAKPLTLEGVFVGVRGHAEGRLMQSHPLSLCNTSEDERQESIFISIVKLENPERRVPQCLPLLEKARLALKRGAQAVIFDVTDDAGAAVELHDSLLSSDYLLNPVVLVQAKDAEVLMGLVNRNEEAMVRIEVMIEPPRWPHYDVGVLLTVVLAVLAIVMIFAFRYRCKSNRNWDSVHQQTMRAISQLETRTYSSQGCSSSQRRGSRRESASSSGSSPMCAICLEEFLDGQHLRIISCSHEFHKECVDPWLLQHRTCPLCMHNILGAELPPRQPQRARHRHPGLHSPQPHPIPFPVRHHYPRVSNGQYPPLHHMGGSPPLDPRMLHCLPARPLGLAPAHFGCHLSEGHGTRPHRTGSGCRTGRHLGQAHPYRGCYGYRQGCPPPRSASGSRLRASSPPRPGAHGRQDDGSCSGGSYRTERSGYFPDGPASDSSSGPCHGSSSDSVLNCTDVSLQGVYGSWSTFRSSLSSDYDPFVYYGQGHVHRDSLDAGARPRSLDSVVNRSCPEEQVFSHVHYHRHQHHHYEDGERMDEEQGASASKDSPPCQVKHMPCQCPKSDHPDRLPECELPDPPLGPLGLGPPPCRHHRRKKSSCVLEGPAVHFHQSLDLQEDCSIHIHYGQPAGYCCPPDMPPLLPVPLILDSGGMGDWPCCGGHVVWQKRVQQAHSEPQLQGPAGALDKSPCRGRRAGPELAADVCLYCQTLRNSQGSEEESGV